MQSACALFYCHLRLSDCNIFFTLFQKYTTFWKKVIEYKMCFYVYNFAWKMFYSKKNSVRYHKYTQVFPWSNYYSSQVLINFEVSRQILEKYSKNLHDNLSSFAEFIILQTEGQTDRHDEANSPLRNFAKKLKNAVSNSEYVTSEYRVLIEKLTLKVIERNCRGVIRNSIPDIFRTVWEKSWKICHTRGLGTEIRSPRTPVCKACMAAT